MQRGFSIMMLVFLVAILAIVGAGSFYLFNQQQLAAINSFNDCAKKYPVMESYPAQCNTPDGRHFVQELSDEERQKLVLPTALENTEANDDSCIQNKKDQIGTLEYIPGDILVGVKGKDLETSKKIISGYGLTYQPSSELEALSIIQVKVTPGEEFKWLCTFEKNPAIKYAELNSKVGINN